MFYTNVTVKHSLLVLNFLEIDKGSKSTSLLHPLTFNKNATHDNEMFGNKLTHFGRTPAWHFQSNPVSTLLKGNPDHY